MSTSDATSKGSSSVEHEGLHAVVRLLAEVLDGGDDARLPDNLPAAHPLRELHESVNALLDALSEQRDRRAQIQVELEERLTTIEMQRAVLRELSTPVIEVWRGVLCLPIVGVMDGERSAQMMERLLHEVTAKAAAYVILDITGVEHMDSDMLSRFVAMANAAQLLGASCVLTGIRPTVAQTLATLDVDTSAITTLRSVREALTRIIPQRA